MIKAGNSNSVTTEMWYILVHEVKHVWWSTLFLECTPAFSQHRITHTAPYPLLMRLYFASVWRS